MITSRPVSHPGVIGGLLLLSAATALPALDVGVWPDKLCVKPGEPVRITVSVRGAERPAQVECRVLRGLGAEVARFTATTDADGHATFEYRPQQEFGHEVWAMAADGSGWADGREYFACAANPFAAAIDYGSVSTYAQLDLLPDRSPAPRGEPQNPEILSSLNRQVADCRRFYHSLIESGTIYGTFSPGAPPNDNFFMGSYIFGSVNGWRKSIQLFREQGISSMVYGAAFLTGLGGSDFARKNPDLLSYGVDGWFMSDLNTESTQVHRDFINGYPGSLKTVKMEWWKGIMGNYPDLLCGRPCFVDPRATDLGIKAILDACAALDIMGVRFDGHFSVPCMGDPLAMATKLTDWQGNPQPVGDEGDRLTGRNMRRALAEVRTVRPDFLFGFNFAGFRPDSWGFQDLNREEIKAIAPGSWILDECAKGALSPSHPDYTWAGFIRNLGGEADRVRSFDAHLFAGWGGGPAHKDFDSRLVRSVSWALGLRWRTGGEFKQHLNPVSYRRDNQFAFRYSQYLVANARTHLPAAEAERLVKVGAKRPVWSRDFVFRSRANGERCLVASLINAPLEDHLTTEAVPPPPARELRMEVDLKAFEGAQSMPDRVMVLSPDQSPFARGALSARIEGGRLKLELPDLPLWCVVVMPY